MARHSKNNTSNSVFSYAEYQKASEHYGTKRQRLGQDSMRNRLSCSLCLQRAREPTACAEGHLYCKECIYTDLLNQKTQIKRYQAKLETWAAEEEADREKARLAAKERVLKDFEAKQLGLSAPKRTPMGPVAPTGSKEKDDGALEARGTKRKLELLDQDQVDTLAREAEDAALKQIEMEQAEARRAKLPDFWLPSLTPGALPGPLKDIKLQTLCHATSPAHVMSLKSLIPVTFAFSSTTQSSSTSTSSSNDEPEAICPCCKKGLSNSQVAFLIKSCSHVVCKTCCDTLVRTSHQCIVCDKKAKDKDIVELARDGTGYAAGGRAESTKAGISFQG